MAQQVSTQVACRLAERALAAYPSLRGARSPDVTPDATALRAFGLTTRRAECCVAVLAQSESLLARVRNGQSWEDTLGGIKGVGPWTVTVFRIMVLRDPDVLPIGDAALRRAITNAYGRNARADRLAPKWRPYRSVACWYLWRSLGNEPLG
jgi:DNA-3-methyladenine glycosylase II